jgi:hypothetical protein
MAATPAPEAASGLEWAAPAQRDAGVLWSDVQPTLLHSNPLMLARGFPARSGC